MGSGVKALSVGRFTGLADGHFETGRLTEGRQVRLLSSGALRSLLSERRIDGSNAYAPPEPGVYTGSPQYDADYETPITKEWIYGNILPMQTRIFSDAEARCARFLIGEDILPGKTENGYRNILGAFSDSGDICVLYDAVFSMIEQQRDMELSAVGHGAVVQISAANSGSGTETYTRFCTVHQLWMDTYTESGDRITQLLDAVISHTKTVDGTSTLCTLVSADRQTYHYFGNPNAGEPGGAYTAKQDRVYRAEYPKLGNSYRAEYTPYSVPMRLVRYRNASAQSGAYASAGEKLLLLPDRLLLRREGLSFAVEARECASIPAFTDAVQHFGRLFGVIGDRIYASADGNCTDFTPSAAEDTDPARPWTETAAGADGGFTAIRSFGGKVIAFTAESMMTVQGTELPFMLSYLGAFGCPSGAAVRTDSALYFVSKNGLMRYTGSRVESVGALLPCTDYTGATLSVCGGLLLLCVPSGLYYYDPASGEWTERGGSCLAEHLVEGDILARNTVGGTRLFRAFGTPGAFFASVALAFEGRRRLQKLSVTVSGASDASLTVRDASGTVWLYIPSLSEMPRTYTALLRDRYMDSGTLHLSGSGDMTLYGMRIEYTPVPCRIRQLWEETE